MAIRMNPENSEGNIYWNKLQDLEAESKSIRDKIAQVGCAADLLASDGNKRVLIEELLAVGSQPARKRPKRSPVSVVVTNPAAGDDATESIDDSVSETTGSTPI
jgi:hypothetical protein